MSNNLATSSFPALPQRTACYNHPDDVMRDETLGSDEKREVLASWASDSRAVAGAPRLRQLESGAVVDLDVILRALQSLDASHRAVEPPSMTANPFVRSARRHEALLRWRKTARRVFHQDDDDDPPPCPASNVVPLPSHVVPAYGRLAA